MIASYAADGVSYVATGKSVSDHGISEVTGRDCALWRVIKGRAICKDEPTERAEPAPVEAGQQATLPPGSPGTAMAGRHHYLVLGSFADLRNAERLAAGYRDRHVTQASVDGRLTHRVIAGPLSDREATQLQQRLVNADQPHAWEIASLPPGV
jgi:hypothetical protein